MRLDVSELFKHSHIGHYLLAENGEWMKHAYHIQAEEDDCSENMQLAIGIGCSVYNSSASGKNCWLVPLENCTELRKKIISESFRKGLKLRVSGFAMVEIAKNVLGKRLYHCAMIEKLDTNFCLRLL